MKLMLQTWSDLVFIHQEVDPGSLRKLIPEPLKLDTFDGKAYVAFVPFIMKDIRPLALPSIPYFSSMHEFNLRTYVRYKDQIAVYFFSLDATKSVHIEFARNFFKLNYLKADIHYDRNSYINCKRNDNRDYTVEFEAKFEIQNQSKENPLLTWLTERYSYLEAKNGNVYQGKLQHAPWQFQELKLQEIKENYLENYGIKAINDDYLCHFAKETKVEIKSFKMIT